MTIATIEPAALPARMEYAQAVSVANLLPEAFRRQPANVLIAMEVADALQMRPFMVMQEMAVISGRPSFSAKFMRALVRRAGHRLRESYADGTARCVIVRHDDPDYEHVATWDEAKARDHGYWGKGHWTKNPALMLSNRALSECVRSACPEVLGGVAYTPDEVQDFAPTQAASQAAPEGRLGADGIRARIAAKTDEPEPGPMVTAEDVAACDDPEALRAMWHAAGPDLRVVIEAKGRELASVNPATGEVVEAELVTDERDPWAEGADQ